MKIQTVVWCSKKGKNMSDKINLLGVEFTEFDISAVDNLAIHNEYFNRLFGMAISRVKWKNLPLSIDKRFLNVVLCTQGRVVYFQDDVLGDMALPVRIGAGFDPYLRPKVREAYSASGYRKDLNEQNSVIIYNNNTRTSTLLDIINFANKLYELDQIIMINARAQKTPLFLQCPEKQKLALLNMYKKYLGNEPAIFAYKGQFDENAIKVLTTGAPFIADKIYQLKVDTWSDALTALGIANVPYEKRERMTNEEIAFSNGAALACRANLMSAYEWGCEQINDMFDRNISVEFIGDSLATTFDAEKIEVNENE